ncbi:MAG: protein kinase [Ilumatobacteraceae bacterium]
MPEVLVGRYVLGDELGRGGMARVVRARDLRLHRAVAIKLLDVGEQSAVDPGLRARFVREARAAASFTHPHAVSVFDAGDAGGVLYLVMELVEGTSLATLLARDGPFSIDRSRRLVDQVLQALAAAHRAGIVHRDVKPGNVLVTADGIAKLSDFGIAKRLDDLGGDLTMPGHVVGTPSSMAPEQVTGQPATPATDLYAAGVLLFQVLVNAAPFDAGSSVATALAHRDAPVPDVRERRPEVPAELAAVIHTAMAKAPVDRFSSADEMRAALVAPPSRSTAPAGPASSGGPNDRTSVATAVLPQTEVAAAPRTWWWWLALVLLVVVGAAAAVAVLSRGDGPAARPAATSVPTAATPSSTVLSTAAPTAAVTTAPGTTAAPATTVGPVPTVAVAPSTIDGMIAMIDDDPGRFGPLASELQRDLERIAERRGRQLERDVQRLRDRLAEWSANGDIDPDVAALVDTILADEIAAVGGDGGPG